MDIHAPIHAFLQQQSITPLPGDIVPFADQQYMKAGIIPFVREAGEIRYLMMKPVAKKGALTPPSFQICKGTRMYLHRGSGWRDMKAGDEPVEGKEPLVVTALREGIEEVGLKLEAIASLQDVGPHKFSSETTGKNKYMWLFTAELGSAEALLPVAEVAHTTAERGWLTLAEFSQTGRIDHRAIISDIENRLLSII